MAKRTSYLYEASFIGTLIPRNLSTSRMSYLQLSIATAWVKGKILLPSSFSEFVLGPLTFKTRTPNIEETEKALYKVNESLSSPPHFNPEERK